MPQRRHDLPPHLRPVERPPRPEAQELPLQPEPPQQQHQPEIEAPRSPDPYLRQS